MSSGKPPGLDPMVEFAVWDWPRQELVVELRGSDVAHFGPQRVTDDDHIPDPVNAFVAAARRGMLTRATVAPWESSASVVTRQVTADGVADYRIAINNLDSGALRILTNLLRARDLESVKVRSVGDGVTVASKVELAGLSYPQHFQPTGFRVDYEEPVHTHKDRSVQLMLVNSPDDSQSEAAFAALDEWALLLRLGGYPGDDQAPAQSGAAPDGPFLFDEHTIELAFPDLFLCDEASFESLINWVQWFHVSVAPVETLAIR